ncbi:MAG: cytochrome P450, partial [Steroidobacteraceae bacterium]
LPITATCNLIGVSDVEAQSLADMILKIESNTGGTLKGFNDAVQQFFKAVTDERRKSPVQDTIVDTVARAEIDGQPIAEVDMLHLLWVLFLGGIDSTVHAATGGLLALFHHPKQLEALRGDPGLIKTAVEEILRWTSTSHANKRQATQDFEIHGTRIKSGDFVTVWSPSANRDEQAYPDPFRFDVRRNITRPIATFGMGGKHTCIGQYFARLELRVLLEELFRRYPNVEQAAPMVRSPAYTMQISPISSLPVRLKH